MPWSSKTSTLSRLNRPDPLGSSVVGLDILSITDPGCPFAWSAEPALAALRYRYRTSANWRLAMIGLSDDPSVYDKFGFTPTKMAQSFARFSRLYGVPVTTEVRTRNPATYPACKLVVATRLAEPEREAAVLRALQVAWFTTTDLLDEDDALEAAIGGVPGIDAQALVAMARTDSAVAAAFAEDLEVARSAAGSPTEAQGKHATAPDGRARYTAPSLIMTGDNGQSLEAGGFQPLAAYDVVIANVDPTLDRSATEDALEAIAESQWPLCAAEVAAIIAKTPEDVDNSATETSLIELAGDGTLIRHAAGNGAFWSLA